MNSGSLATFPWRAVMVGIPTGILICVANIYFGLQIGAVSTMVLPSTLLGFAIFKVLAPILTSPFTAAENVVLQTTATSLGGMPLTAGYTGLIPAMEFLMEPTDGGATSFSLGQLFLWYLAVCVFGVIFAIPLRRRFILRERLPFPSGTATAVVLGILYHERDIGSRVERDRNGVLEHTFEARAARSDQVVTGSDGSHQDSDSNSDCDQESRSNQSSWQRHLAIISIGLVLSCSTVSRSDP